MRCEVRARGFGGFHIGTGKHGGQVLGALALAQGERNAGPGLTRRAAAHRVHDDQRRAGLLDRGLDGIGRLEIFKAQAS